jgi:hypothetical protein
MVAYRKRMAKFPLKLPSGPQDELCPLFKELQLNVMVLPMPAQPRNSWISTPTWVNINKRAMLRQQGKLPKQASRCTGRQIAARLKGDRQHQAADVAANIKMHLVGRETKELWRCLKGWYKTASESTPAASPMLLTAQTAKRVNLYRRAPPPRGTSPYSHCQGRHSGWPPQQRGVVVSCLGTSKWACRGGIWTAGRAHQSVAPQCHAQGGQG